MGNGYMDSTLHDQQARERSLAYTRATDAAERRALGKKRVNLLEAAIRDAIGNSKGALDGLDARGAATLVVLSWGG